MQHSLRSGVTFRGVGLHSGAPVVLEVLPAPVGHGIVFERRDLTDLAPQDRLVPALWDAVVPSRLCTLLRNGAGASVSTVEHVMAALAGCGIHNALLRIDGPEVPILDGSSALFVEAMVAAGIVAQGVPVRAIRVLAPVEVRDGDAVARLTPADMLEIDFRIDFEVAAIGRQHKHLNMSNGAFVRELCDSRTFCRQSDVDAMRANGLALGGTLDNAVVIEGDRILNPGGLRHADEPVRHKMLDALGDLALAGAPVLGRYTGSRAGHALTNKLLRELFARPDAWEWVECRAPMQRKMPGIGVSLRDIPTAA